ncbi:MAG TPA: hypothetical protein VFV69_14020 [Steroidobacteraceae bacterium]|jgi:hypothetical protein|nr:hypothetical protein [Steroidobacteraceae bacterium]
MNRPVAAPPGAHTDDADDVVAARPARRRARFELIFAGIWLAVGLLLLPALIFTVGGSLLGPYGDNGGLGRFYGDFFGDLAEPSVRAWAIALGPLVLISILRLIFVGAGREPEKPRDQDDELRPAPPRRHAPEDHRRVEPRVSGD